MNEMEHRRKVEAELDRVLGLAGPGASVPSVGSPVALDSDRKTAAWEGIQARLSAETVDRAPDPRFAPPEIARGSMNRRGAAAWLAAAAALLIVFGGVWTFNRELERVPTARLPGTVAFVQGRVTRAGTLLRKGDLLQAGDEIVTGPNGRLDFIVDEKNAFRLLSSANMRYDVQAGGGRIDLRRGYMAAVLRRRDRIRSLELVTGPVVSRVTGTTLFVGTPEAKAGYICICNGRVEVHDATRHGGHASAPRTREAIHHHAGLFVREGEGPVRELPGDMRFHDDPMLEDLARLIDERIDWRVIELSKP